MNFFTPQGQQSQTPANPSDPNTPGAEVEQAAQGGDGGNQNFDPAPTERQQAELTTDDAGNLIDPPRITSYETDLAEAAANADTARMQSIQEKYDAERLELAQDLANRQQEG